MGELPEQSSHFALWVTCGPEARTMLRKAKFHEFKMGRVSHNAECCEGGDRAIGPKLNKVYTVCALCNHERGSAACTQQGLAWESNSIEGLCMVIGGKHDRIKYINSFLLREMAP